MTTTNDDVRLIDSGQNPTRFARGWHLIGLARDLKGTGQHKIEIFGTKIVVFTDSKGELQALDAYCRHMGGDLSQGEVKGDCIACPFHDWRWGGDGRCKEIPYTDRVPLGARTRTWPLCEVNGQVFVWNDPEGNGPIAEQAVPAIEGYGSEDWTDWYWETEVITGSNCREIVDNVVDMAHFFYIHHSFPTYFKNVFDGHIAAQDMNSRSRPDIDNGSGYSRGELRSESAYYGPSYMIDYLWMDMSGMPVEVVLINCHYPITNDSFKLQWGSIVRKVAGLPDGAAEAMSKGFADGVSVGFRQDVEIWKNKSRIDNPLLCEDDGPVYQLRRWYEQFYVDVADIQPDMTDRFEFEIDTTRAVRKWEAQTALFMEQNRKAGYADGRKPQVAPASFEDLES